MRRTFCTTAIAVLVSYVLAVAHAEEKKLPQDTVRERLMAKGAQVQQDGSLTISVGKTEVRWRMGAYRPGDMPDNNTSFSWSMKPENDGKPIPRQLPQDVSTAWTEAAKDILPQVQIDMGKKVLKEIWRSYSETDADFRKVGKAIATPRFESYFAYGEQLSAVGVIQKHGEQYHAQVDFDWTDNKSDDAVASLDRYAKTLRAGDHVQLNDMRIEFIAKAKFEALKAAGKPAQPPPPRVLPPDQNPAWAKYKFMENTLQWKTFFDIANVPLGKALFLLGVQRNCTTIRSLGDVKRPPVSLSVKDTPMRAIYERMITGADVECEIVDEAVFVFKKGWYPHPIDMLPNAETKQAVAGALARLNGAAAADQDAGKQALRKLGVHALSELRVAYQASKDDALRTRIADIYPELVGPMWFYEDPATTAALNALGTKETYNYQADAPKVNLAERVEFLRKYMWMKNPPQIEVAPDVANRFSDTSLFPMKYGNILRWLARLHDAKIVVDKGVLRVVNFKPSPSDPPLTLSLGTDPVLPAVKPPQPPNTEF